MATLKRLFKISWRNVFRNKRRSLLTLSILTMGCTGLILVGGFFDNIMEGFREQFIHSQSGHLQVSRTDYFEKGATAPFDYLLKDVSALQRQVEGLPHVLYTVPRLKFSGMASSDKTSVAALVLGADPEREYKMGRHQALNTKADSLHVVEGKNLDASDPYGAVLGKGLMKALGLKVGDTFNFITTREAGAIDGMEFHVRGAFETIVKDFDDRGMKVTLSSAQKILNVPDEVHSLLVMLDDTGNTKTVQTALAQQFREKGQNLEVVPWQEQALLYMRSKELFDKIYLTVTLIMGVVFFFSIANTINMALLERMREFGTMMAIGNSRLTIFSVIFLEALVLGICGAVLGILFGCGVAAAVSSVGIEMPPPPQGGAPYFAMINLEPRLLLQVAALALFSTLLASLIPALRACHFRITQALGYV